jgi:hypothetical protein
LRPTKIKRKMDINSDLRIACADIQARKTFVGNVKYSITLLYIEHGFRAHIPETDRK